MLPTSGDSKSKLSTTTTKKEHKKLIRDLFDIIDIPNLSSM